MRKVLLAIGAIAVVIGIAISQQTGNVKPTPASALTAPQVNVDFTSDPTDSEVTIDGRVIGRTPLTVAVEAGKSHTYSLRASEPYADYNLYVRYTGTLTATEDTSVSVWLDRTTAQQQAEAKARAVEQRAAAQREACQRQLNAYTIIIESWHWGRTAGGSYVKAEGRVTNNTTKTLRNIQAMVEYETSSGQFITSDFSTIDLRDLLPGQSSPFSVMTSYNPAMHSASLRFREFYGPLIPAGSRERINCSTT